MYKRGRPSLWKGGRCALGPTRQGQRAGGAAAEAGEGAGISTGSKETSHHDAGGGKALPLGRVAGRGLRSITGPVFLPTQAVTNTAKSRLGWQ